MTASRPCGDRLCSAHWVVSTHGLFVEPRRATRHVGVRCRAPHCWRTSHRVPGTGGGACTPTSMPDLGGGGGSSSVWRLFLICRAPGAPARRAPPPPTAPRRRPPPPTAAYRPTSCPPSCATVVRHRRAPPSCPTVVRHHRDAHLRCGSSTRTAAHRRPPPPTAAHCRPPTDVVPTVERHRRAPPS